MTDTDFDRYPNTIPSDQFLLEGDYAWIIAETLDQPGVADWSAADRACDICGGAIYLPDHRKCTCVHGRHTFPVTVDIGAYTTAGERPIQSRDTRIYRVSVVHGAIQHQDDGTYRVQVELWTEADAMEGPPELPPIGPIPNPIPNPPFPPPPPA